MGKGTTQGTARGGKLSVGEKAPSRGEPEYSTNKTAPSKMGGGPKDLSHSIPGAKSAGGNG